MILQPLLSTEKGINFYPPFVDHLESTGIIHLSMARIVALWAKKSLWRTKPGTTLWAGTSVGQRKKQEKKERKNQKRTKHQMTLTDVASSPARETGVTSSLHFGDEHFIPSCLGSVKNFTIIPFHHLKTSIVISSLQCHNGQFSVGCEQIFKYRQIDSWVN